MSVSDVHWFSTASTRKPDLSSLIHFWMHETISPSLRCVAAMRNASSVSAEQVLDALAPHRDVVLEAVGLGGEVGREAVEQLLRLVDPVPAQVVQHPARDPHQQVLVGLPQELDDHPPLALLGRREVLHRRLPVAQRGLQPALHQEMAQALGDRVDELPLLLEERPLVGARHLAGVEDLDRPDLLALHHDVGALHPRRLDDARRLVHHVVERDLGPAHARVLPAGRQHLGQRRGTPRRSRRRAG